MARRFTYDISSGFLSDDRGPICRIDPAHIGGAIHDTGALIAKLLTWHAEACEDMHAPFFGPILDMREGR